MAVVDMTTFGLQGQQAFAERMQTLAQAKNAEATAKVNEVNAQTGIFELAQAERMADLDARAAASLQALAAGERPAGSGVELDPSSAASPHEHLGRFYLQAGAVERGTALLNDAHKIRKEEADMENDKWLAQERRLNNIQKGAEIVSQNLGIARNESEWRLGLRRVREAVDQGLFVMEPELLQQLEDMPYDPEAAAYFNQAAIDAKGRAELELRQESEARQAAVAAAQLAQGATRVQISAARLEETRRHNANMEKFAGRGTNANTEVTATARDAMAARLVAGPMAQIADPITGKLVDRNSSIVQDMAIRLEEDARILLNRVPGLTMDQARERAVQQAIQAGEIVQGTPDTSSIPFRDNSTPGSVKRSSARDQVGPMPVPDDPALLEVDKEYYNAEGRRAVWTGTGFRAVQ